MFKWLDEQIFVMDLLLLCCFETCRFSNIPILEFRGHGSHLAYTCMFASGVHVHVRIWGTRACSHSVPALSTSEFEPGRAATTKSRRPIEESSDMKVLTT
jgi:hypothetical protein